MSTKWVGWAAWHPKHGFMEGMAHEGSGLLRVYEDLDKELIDDIKETNVDEPQVKWIAVKVEVTAIDTGG